MGRAFLRHASRIVHVKRMYSVSVEDGDRCRLSFDVVSCVSLRKICQLARLQKRYKIKIAIKQFAFWIANRISH